MVTSIYITVVWIEYSVENCNPPVKISEPLNHSLILSKANFNTIRSWCDQ